MSKNALRFKAKVGVDVPETKTKYVKEQEGRLNDFIPTKVQEAALEVMHENTLTFISAPPGTGKSSLVLWDYCKEYLRDKTKQIVVIKSPTEAGQLDKIGFLKG